MAIAFGSSTTATANLGGNNAGTFSINVPASTSDNDMLLLAVVVSESSGVNSTVSGFTLARRHDGIQDGAGYDFDLCTQLFWRRASSEPASYTVTPDGTYGNYVAATMLRYTGVIKTGDPFRTVGSVSRTNAWANPQTSTTLSGVQATDMAFHVAGECLGAWNTNTFDLAGPGGGWTERGEVYMTAASSGKPGILCLEQLGSGSAPAVTASGTAATASNIGTVFVAGALMAEPAAAARPTIINTAVRRASVW
jgi:hypothetical protein